MTLATETHTLAVLLDWYRAMGADAALTEEPIDWLLRGDTPPGHGYAIASAHAPDRARPPAAASEAAAPAAATRASAPASARPATTPQARPPLRPPAAPERPRADPPARSFQTPPPDTAELSAREAARTATSLADLETALHSFDGCGLKATAKNLCFYRGAEHARIMIIGEAPGRDEDHEGRPFVGPAGQLLDKMLAAIGLTERNVHITNVVYWRPPGNRTPTPQETQVCRPFLERQIELVAPEILVLLGGAAAKHVLDVTDGIMRIRGKWRDAAFGPRSIKAMATLHPAYLLRTPAAKRLAWRDLLAIKAALS